MATRTYRSVSLDGNTIKHDEKKEEKKTTPVQTVANTAAASKVSEPAQGSGRRLRTVTSITPQQAPQYTPPRTNAYSLGTLERAMADYTRPKATNVYNPEEDDQSAAWYKTMPENGNTSIPSDLLSQRRQERDAIINNYYAGGMMGFNARAAADAAGGIYALMVEQQMDAENDRKYKALLNGIDVDNMSFLERTGGALGNIITGTEKTWLGNKISAISNIPGIGNKGVKAQDALYSGAVDYLNAVARGDGGTSGSSGISHGGGGRHFAGENPTAISFTKEDADKEIQRAIKLKYSHWYDTEDNDWDLSTGKDGNEVRDQLVDEYESVMQKLNEASEAVKAGQEISDDYVRSLVDEYKFDMASFGHEEAGKYIESGREDLEYAKTVNNIQELIGQGGADMVVDAASSAMSSAQDMMLTKLLLGGFIGGIGAAGSSVAGKLLDAGASKFAVDATGFVFNRLQDIAGMAGFAQSSYGGAAYEAREKLLAQGLEIGAEEAKKIRQYAAANTGIELASEMLFSSVGAIKNASGNSIFDGFSDVFGESLQKFASTPAGARLLKTLGEKLGGGIEEGLEEVIGDVVRGVCNVGGIIGEDEAVSLEEMIKDFSVGFISGLMGEVTNAGYNYAARNQIGNDVLGGVTEQTYQQLYDIASSMRETPESDLTYEGQQMVKAVNKVDKNGNGATPQNAGRLYQAFAEANEADETGQARAKDILNKAREGQKLTDGDLNLILQNDTARGIVENETGEITGKSGTEQRKNLRDALNALASAQDSLKAGTEEYSRYQEAAARAAHLEPLNKNPLFDGWKYGFQANMAQMRAPVMDAAERIGIGAEGKGTMASLYTGRQDAIQYVEEMTRFYNQGLNNNEFDIRPLENGTISLEQAQSAFNAGRVDYLEEARNGQEGTEVRVRGGVQRDGGQSSGGQAGRVAEAAGRAEGRGEAGFRGGQVLKGLRNGSQVSAQDLGIVGGSARKNIRVVTESQDKHISRAKELVEKRGLNFVGFSGGALEVGNVKARGFYDPSTNTIYVRTDHGLFHADQIAAHEVMHDMIRKGEVNLAGARDLIIDKVGAARFSAVMDKYAGLYEGTGLSREDIFEEMICDAAGNLNEFARAGHMTDALEAIPVYEAAKEAVKGAKSGRTIGEESESKLSRELDKELKERYPEYKNDSVNLNLAKEALLNVRENNSIQSLSNVLGTEGEAGIGKSDNLSSGNGYIPGAGRNNLGSIRTIGKAITTEILQKGGVNLTGRKVSSVEDLAKLCQVFRDPRFETARWFYVRKGRIVGSDALTSKLPGAAQFSEGSNQRYPVSRFFQKAVRLKADSFYIMHNHPSGNVMESREDVQSTINIAQKELKKFNEKSKSKLKYAGHIIIDHDVYNSIDAEGNASIREIPERSFEFLLTPSVDDYRLDENVLTDKYPYYIDPDKVASLGKTIGSDESSAIIYMDASAKIRQLQEVPNSVIKNNKQLADYIINQRRESGSRVVVVYTKDWQVLRGLEVAYREGKIQDVIVDAGKNGTERLANLSKYYKDAAYGYNPGENDLYLNGKKIQKKKFSRELDDSYMKAIESGNMEEAQRMVDDAAERAGYTLWGIHGTTNFFTIFSRDKANPEGDWGSGFYFTDSEEDAEENYASNDGPDLTNKIEHLADMLEYEEPYADMDYEERLEIARKRLSEGNPRTIQAALRLENPVVIGDGAGLDATYFEFYQEYDEETDEYGDPEGELFEFIDALKEIAADYVYNSQQVDEKLNELLWEYVDGAYAGEVAQKAKEILSEYEAQNDNGELVGHEIVRQAFEQIGYDGIVDNTVSKKFKNMKGLDSTTAHYIVFSSDQAKITDPVTYDNDGNIIPLSERFNEKNPDIRFSRELKSESIRAAGEKLTEKQFYQLYSAHKIYAGAGDVESRIRGIKKDGFNGDGGQYGTNLMPTQFSVSVDKDGNRVPGNVSVAKYGPKKGDYILLVPRSGAEINKNYDRVKPGYKPMFDYEIVRADYNYQPYYEMYSKAYDAARKELEKVGVSVEKESDVLTGKHLSTNRVGSQQEGLFISDILRNALNVKSEVKASRELGNTDLYEQNRQLKSDLREAIGKLKARTEQRDYWRGQTKVTKGRQLRMDDVNRLSKDLKKGIDSDADISSVAAKIKALGEYALNSQEDFDTMYDKARTMAYEVAHEILDNAKVLKDNGGDTFYKDFRDRLRMTKVYVAPSVRSELAPDGWSDFRKSLLGTVTLTADNASGTTIDKVYQDMRDEFGDWLFPEEFISEADQLSHILEIVETFRPVYENMNSFDMADAVEYMANDILGRVLGDEIRETDPTYADKMEKKLADQKAKTKEALRKVREQRDKREAAIKEHYKEVAENKRARRLDSSNRTKLLKIARRLNNMKLPRVTRALLDEYIGNLDLVSKGITGKTLQDLESLNDWYEEWVDRQKKELGDDNFVPDSVIEGRLKRLKKRRISEMTQEEVADLTTVLLGIEHAVGTENQLIDSEERRDAYTSALDFMSDYKGSQANSDSQFAQMLLFGSAGQKGGDGLLSPERAVHRLVNYNDSDPVYRLTKELAAGQRKMQDYERRAEERFLKWTQDKKFVNSIAGKDAKLITVKALVNGEMKDVQITPAMRMSLYLHAKNEQNLKHLEKGGVLIPNIEAYKKGKLNNAYKAETENRAVHGTRAVFSRYMVHEIAKGMTEQERAFADAAFDYFNSMSKEAINEVSVALKGYEIATVGKYFPIDTSKDFLKADYGMIQQDGSVANQGFTHERVESTKPMMLYDMNTILTRSIKGHSRYYGLAVPIRNLNRVLNVQKIGYEGEGSVRNLLLDEHLAYIDKMIRDVQTGAPGDGGILSSMRSKYAGGVLSLNAGVALKQAASYPTAAAVIGYAPLVKALKNPTNKKVDLDLIAKYTPLLWYRSKGYSTAELGDIGNREGVAARMMSHKALNWIQGVDLWTTTKLWTAAEYYVQEQNKNLQYGTDAFYQEVANVYNRIIEETQPNYAAMQRPGILRSDGQLKRAMNMFKTQPFQNANILIDAVGNYRAKARQYKAAIGSQEAQEAMEALQVAKKSMVRAITSQALSAFVFSMMQFAWDALRGKTKKYKDDDDELTIWTAGRGVFLNMLMSLGGMVPFGGTALELLESTVDKIAKELGGDAIFDQKFYGLSENSLEAINDLANSAQNLMVQTLKAFKGTANAETVARNIVNELASVVHLSTGLPASNVVKDMQVVAINAMRFYERASAGFFTDEGKLMAEYAALRITTDPSKYKSDYYSLLFKAYTKDDAAYRKIRDRMINSPGDPFATASKSAEENIDTAIKKRANENITGKSFYSNEYEKLTASSIYSQATPKQQSAVLSKLEEIAKSMQGTGNSNGDSYVRKIEGGEKYGLDTTEYLLYTIALQMVDQPNKNGKLGGTPTNDEVENAIAMIPGLSNEEKAYLWDAAGKNEKTNPWR